MNKVINWRYTAVAAFILLISACARIPVNWHGVSSKRLFRAYGYPTRIARLSQGNCLLIYKHKKSPCGASFTVNKKEKIIGVHYFGGVQCESEFQNGRKRS